MMYNYPFFSFPHFRKYSNYYPMQNQYKNLNYVNNISSFDANNLQRKSLISKHNSYLNSKKYEDEKDFFKSKQNERKADYYKEKSYKAKENINVDDLHKSKKSVYKKFPSGFNFLNNFLHQDDRSDDEDYFDLFGIKLYNDDLLLIGLIFFLYKEDVKDQYLFFSLILLLLS